MNLILLQGFFLTTDAYNTVGSLRVTPSGVLGSSCIQYCKHEPNNNGTVAS